MGAGLRRGGGGHRRRGQNRAAPDRRPLLQTFRVRQSPRLGPDGCQIAVCRRSGTALVVYLHYFTKIIHFLVHDHPDTRNVLLNDFYDVMFFKPCAFRFLNLEIIGFVMH
ncbi:hypothetical protein RHGRI_030185 [Rhododendron griersonianum]|uniref:Uncharacterized protein n=1 Tax=Rhododendron griersonianum TaxID=479676 RepID=A0AAV6IM38_9ERIC|nr:hypothetical protein RHGRI_030185 [Rhododendron griersonianum]